MKAYQGVQQHNLSTFDVCNDDSKTCFWVEVVFFSPLFLFSLILDIIGVLCCRWDASCLHWLQIAIPFCHLSKRQFFFFAFYISNLPTSNAQTEEIVHMPFVVSNPDIVERDCTDFVEFVSLWKLEVLEETRAFSLSRLCSWGCVQWKIADAFFLFVLGWRKSKCKSCS